MVKIIANYSALIATLWIVIGVYIAGLFYKGYDHAKQFCSELGATGSPTEKLSPLINNYPLGLLFCAFGWFLIQIPATTNVLLITGACVIVHGVATWVAGFFPMDADPYTKEPTLSCKIHSWAGFIMLISLTLAPLIIAFSPTNNAIPLFFRFFSIICVIAMIYFLFAMAKAVKKQAKPGLYQRISYGVQLIWLSALSLVL